MAQRRRVFNIITIYEYIACYGKLRRTLQSKMDVRDKTATPGTYNVLINVHDIMSLSYFKASAMYHCSRHWCVSFLVELVITFFVFGKDTGVPNENDYYSDCQRSG